MNDEYVKRAIQVLEDNPDIGLVDGSDPNDPLGEMVSVRRIKKIIPIPLINANGANWPVWRPQVIDMSAGYQELIGKEFKFQVQPMAKHIPNLLIWSPLNVKIEHPDGS